MEIRIGKDGNQLRIKHYSLIKEPLPDDALTVAANPTGMVNVIHLYSGALPSVIRTQYTMDQVLKMYLAIHRQFSRIRVPEKPPKEVNLGGTMYELIDPKRIGINWHIDYGGCDIDLDPVKLATMFYHPKGVKYGELDHNQNMICTSADRRHDIEQHMELGIFLSAAAFFLKKYERSTRTFTAKRKANLAMQTLLKRLGLLRKNPTIGKN